VHNRIISPPIVDRIQYNIQNGQLRGADHCKISTLQSQCSAMQFRCLL